LARYRLGGVSFLVADAHQWKLATLAADRKISQYNHCILLCKLFNNLSGISKLLKDFVNFSWAKIDDPVSLKELATLIL
jgi:hypothetical protein